MNSKRACLAVSLIAAAGLLSAIVGMPLTMAGHSVDPSGDATMTMGQCSQLSACGMSSDCVAGCLAAIDHQATAPRPAAKNPGHTPSSIAAVNSVALTVDKPPPKSI